MLLEKKNISFRLRTASPGYRSLSTTDAPIAETGRAYHVVCTYRPADGMRTYVDGAVRASNGESGAILAEGPERWRSDYVLTVGNRIKSFDRDWSGEILLAAIYSRALTPEEVAGNHAAGWRGPRRTGWRAPSE
jgi:hypothetical protein